MAWYCWQEGLHWVYRSCQTMFLGWLRTNDRLMNKNILPEATWQKHVDPLPRVRAVFLILSLVPCSPVGHSRSRRTQAALPCFHPMYLFRIRSKSQKRSDRSQDSTSTPNSSSRPPLLPQTNLALSTSEDTCPSSSSSFSSNLDVSSSKPPIGRKISCCEPDEPK